MTTTFELKSGNIGTQVLTDGKQDFTPAAIDLTGVSESGDVALIYCAFRHDDASPLSPGCVIWKDSGASEGWTENVFLSTEATGKHQGQHISQWILVDNPATTLYYHWDTTITNGGLSVWVVCNIKGVGLI